MYEPTIWKDHVTQYPNRRTITDNGDGTQNVEKAQGEVIQQGTPQSATNFNNMEAGIFDSQVAASLLALCVRQLEWGLEDVAAEDLLDHRTAIALLLNAARQNAWSVDRGTVTLTNSQTFPFNNSKRTVALANVQDSEDYLVLTEILSSDGCAGEIEVTDRLVNGFKLGFTGSARTVTVKYTVFGGTMK